ncbi:MAG: hypothetical protein ACR2IF_17335 [Terriglobales bacterium]
MKSIAWLWETSFGLKLIPWQIQLPFIAVGYAAVLACGVLLEYQRDLAALRDPIYSSGGMWAWGDEMLAWSIFFFFLVPTFFLIRLMADFPQTFLSYSRVALWFSLTAPLALAIFCLGSWAGHHDFVDPLLERTWRTPFVFIVIIVTRMFARWDNARRLINRALLIEGGTLAIFLALLITPNLGRS